MVKSNKRTRSETSSEPKEKKKSKQYYDEEGDLEIVSSDGVTFKVNAYILQTFSPVFRDMVKLGSTGDKKPLELDDTVLESAETIANVLDLLLTSKDILILSNPRSVAIICFMKKYSMERELDRIGLQLREAIVNRKKAFSIWLLATVAEMFEIAGSVIESLGYRSWTDELSEDRRELYGECIPKGHVFDTRTWSVINYRLVPPEASWALGRASYKIGKPAGKFEPADYEAMGEEFTRLMKLPRL